MDAFDDMVDDVSNGEILVAEFDTGLTVTVDYESLTLSDPADDGFDIVFNGEVLDLIHIFLEVRHVSRGTFMKVDWDKLLS